MGNSDSCITHFHKYPVHPHVHGELGNTAAHHWPGTGSSPRAWGTHRTHNVAIPCERFIPTCMGNSIYSMPQFTLDEVHPHVHGELIPTFRAMAHSVGSSPRAWGTLQLLQHLLLYLRFIPTCMGNSSFSHSAISALTVHPHVHGELAGRSHCNTIGGGSSPRAWGTHFPPAFPAEYHAVHPHVHGELHTKCLIL